MPMLKKQYIAEDIKVDDDERTITAVISTSAVDRDHEVMVAKGGDFTNYLKNPIVLWAHDYRELPIAKTMWLKQKGSKITAKARFAETAMAEDVYKLYKGGFLNAFSIGFIPNKRHHPSPKEIEKRPELANVYSIIDEWELLEFSAVPVPANPEALMQAIKSKDISLDSLEIAEDIENQRERIYLAEPGGADFLKSQKDNQQIIDELSFALDVPKEQILEAIKTLSKTRNTNLKVAVDKFDVDSETFNVAETEEKLIVTPFFNVTEAANEVVKRHKGIVYD